MVGSGPDGGEDLVSQLARWAAEHRQESEVESRSRQWWLRRQAQESATWEALLADLAEQGATVHLALRSGRPVNGSLECLGRDFVTTRTQRRASFVRLDALAAVHPGPGMEAPAMGRRKAARIQMDLAGVLAWLAEEGSRIAAWVEGAPEAMPCRVRAVGEDVVTLAIEAQPPRVVYVRLASLAEVSLLLSG